MSWAFQFVDHCNGIILNGNRALTRGAYQKLIVSQAKLSRTLAGLQFCRGAQIGPFKLRFFPAVGPELLSSPENRASPSSEDLGYRRRGLQV